MTNVIHIGDRRGPKDALQKIKARYEAKKKRELAEDIAKKIKELNEFLVAEAKKTKV